MSQVQKVFLFAVAVTILFIGGLSRIEVANAADLIVNVGTDKPTYDPGENVVITVRVNELVGGDMLLGVDGANVFVSIEPPGGGIAGWPATPTAIVGEYRYTHHLSPSAAGGVYKVNAQASKAGYTSGSDQTTFTVMGAPGKKSVDWMVYNPSITPPTPTTEDPVRVHVWLKIVATISPGPYPVDLLCTVDGVPVGGETITMSGSPPQLTVNTPPRKYPAGIHTGVWVVDPDGEYNDINLGNNQVTFQFTVSTPAPGFDYSLTSTPGGDTIQAGQAASYTITATLTSGEPEPVTLSVEGLPSGATSTFSAISGDPSFTSTLTVQTSETTPPGTYTLTVKGEGGGLTKTISLTLNVEELPEMDFTVTASPPSRDIHPSQAITYSVTVTPVNEFDSTVSLIIEDLPPGIMGSFNPAVDEPPYTSILTIETAETASTGSYVLTITASGGGKTHATTVLLTLTPSPETTFTEPHPTTTQKGFGLNTLLSNDLFLILIILIVAGIIIIGALQVLRR